MLLVDPHTPCHIAKRWEPLLEMWYGNFSPEAMACLVRRGYMTRLQYVVPAMVAEIHGKPVCEVTPEDIARVDPLYLRSKSRSTGMKTLACLADVLRFAERTTPRDWHLELPRPEFLCA